MKSLERRSQPNWMRRATRRILGVPLTAKLIGANVVIVVAAVVVHATLSGTGDSSGILALVFALAAACVVNIILVRLALAPITQMQVLARRISSGNFDARGTASPLADAELDHLGSTINQLLEELAAERKRIQDLGAEVVFAQDAERARLSRELHDSIAQTLAAVRFQLAPTIEQSTGDIRNRLSAIAGLVASVMEQVRNVSYSLHPRVAEDLGLESALHALARQVHGRSGVAVDVSYSVVGQPPAVNVSATFFRVAQEALRNIEMHASAKSANVDVTGRDGSIRIEIVDDGCGFDQARMRAPIGRSGLAVVRDRVALAGGFMNVDSTPNGGTRVTAELKSLRAAS